MEYSFTKENVSNGIEVCNIFSEGFKSACVSINFIMPLGEKASLYALLPNVLLRASRLYPDVTSIEKKLANLYGAEIIANIQKVGENQILKMAIACIDDRFSFDNEGIVSECSRLMFELIFNPLTDGNAFSKEVVESEKRLLIEELQGEITDKKAYAKNRCDEIMFQNEKYGIHRFGTVEDIKKITAESLYEAYKEVLKNAKITLSISGNTDSEIILKYLSEYVDVERTPINTETVFIEKADKVKYQKEQEQVKQGKLVMGFRLGMKNIDDDFPARRIMVDLFGGSTHSKLFSVVREKMSLCYYCNARMYRAKGVMFVQSGIESYNEEKVKTAILEQLEEVKKGNFTKEDIDASVKALEDGFKSVSDSPETLDAWFMSQCFYGKYYEPEYFIEKFKKVTKEDIVRVANQVTLDTVFMLEGTLEGGEEDE